MPISLTRAIVRAILDGSLAEAPMKTHPVFGVQMPMSCPGCPDNVLDPERSWPDAAAYHTKALELAAMFRKNFETAGGSFRDLLQKAGPAAA